jgi:hypothetical protein
MAPKKKAAAIKNHPPHPPATQVRVTVSIPKSTAPPLNPNPAAKPGPNDYGRFSFLIAIHDNLVIPYPRLVLLLERHGNQKIFRIPGVHPTYVLTSPFQPRPRLRREILSFVHHWIDFRTFTFKAAMADYAMDKAQGRLAAFKAEEQKRFDAECCRMMREERNKMVAYERMGRLAKESQGRYKERAEVMCQELEEIKRWSLGEGKKKTAEEGEKKEEPGWERERVVKVTKRLEAQGIDIRVEPFRAMQEFAKEELNRRLGKVKSVEKLRGQYQNGRKAPEYKQGEDDSEVIELREASNTDQDKSGNLNTNGSQAEGDHAHNHEEREICIEQAEEIKPESRAAEAAQPKKKKKSHARDPRFADLPPLPSPVSELPVRSTCPISGPEYTQNSAVPDTASSSTDAPEYRLAKMAAHIQARLKCQALWLAGQRRQAEEAWREFCNPLLSITKPTLSSPKLTCTTGADQSHATFHTSLDAIAASRHSTRELSHHVSQHMTPVLDTDYVIANDCSQKEFERMLFEMDVLETAKKREAWKRREKEEEVEAWSWEVKWENRVKERERGKGKWDGKWGDEW